MLRNSVASRLHGSVNRITIIMAMESLLARLYILQNGTYTCPLWLYNFPKWYQNLFTALSHYIEYLDTL